MRRSLVFLSSSVLKLEEEVLLLLNLLQIVDVDKGHHGSDSFVDFHVLLLETAFVSVNQIQPFHLVHVLFEEFQFLVQIPSDFDLCILKLLFFFIHKACLLENFLDFIDRIFNQSTEVLAEDVGEDVFENLIFIFSLGLEDHGVEILEVLLVDLQVLIGGSLSHLVNVQNVMDRVFDVVALLKLTSLHVIVHIDHVDCHENCGIFEDSCAGKLVFFVTDLSQEIAKVIQTSLADCELFV